MVSWPNCDSLAMIEFQGILISLATKGNRADLYCFGVHLGLLRLKVGSVSRKLDIVYRDFCDLSYTVRDGTDTRIKAPVVFPISLLARILNAFTKS